MVPMGAPEASRACVSACFLGQRDAHGRRAEQRRGRRPRSGRARNPPSPKPSSRSSIRRVAATPAASGTGCAGLDDLDALAGAGVAVAGDDQPLRTAPPFRLHRLGHAGAGLNRRRRPPPGPPAFGGRAAARPLHRVGPRPRPGRTMARNRPCGVIRSTQGWKRAATRRTGLRISGSGRRALHHPGQAAAWRCRGGPEAGDVARHRRQLLASFGGGPRRFLDIVESRRRGSCRRQAARRGQNPAIRPRATRSLKQTAASHIEIAVCHQQCRRPKP